MTFASGSEDIVPDANGWYGDVFLPHRRTGETTIVSSSADGSGVLSYDGHLVYRAGATNLVPNDTNGKDDIFVTRRS